MENKKILIYGASGYTGKLLAKHLVHKGLRPVLAGRSSKVEQIGQELNCPTRIFSTEDAADHLADIDVLVNVAGPFSATQDGLIKGCLRTKTHYLDIAGEFAEMEQAFKYHSEAQQAGIVILPAAGFGVVPTDVAAKIAGDQIEDPTQLTIIYATLGGASRGTLKTVLKDIQKPGHILKDGKHQKALPAQSELKVDILDKSFKTVYNPWRADLFTAHKSTGIKNIETYSEFPGFVVSMMKGKLNWLRNLILKRLINFLPEGPSEKALAKGSTYVKAIAKNDRGEMGIVELKGPEAYRFTVLSIHKMINLIWGAIDEKGYLTPSMLGTDWIFAVEEIDIKVLPQS
jgi:short subunit dehydrogenase-like uncharacterized protein